MRFPVEEVTAVIPNWNRAELLARALESLSRQTRPCARVLVVDGGSTDASRDTARRLGAEVLVLPSNPGFAAAVNVGVSAAMTHWVWILNNDAEPDPHCLEQLLEHARAAGSWFAAPRLLRHADPSRIDGCYDLLARSGCAWRAGAGTADDGLFCEPRRILFAPFTAALVRRELFARVGALDERFGSYYEDVEFCLRCALLRLHGVYVPEAVALHRGGSTHGPWSASMVELVARNQLLLAAKHFPAAWAWRVLAGQLLWGSLAARHGRLLPWLRGKARGMLAAPGARRSWRRAPRTLLEPLLIECETEIRRLQLATHPEPYWRLYFAVAR
ncbi:MAG: glycosyltransferase family 2 protein [Bryobacteraceae bacterium]